MTIRELLEVFAPEREIYIKPNGRRVYFDGITEDVPECLMELSVQEILPRIFPTESDRSNYRFYWALAVYVDAVPLLNAIVDAVPDIAKTSPELYDGCYADALLDTEKCMAECEAIIASRKARSTAQEYKANIYIYDLDNTNEQANKEMDNGIEQQG